MPSHCSPPSQNNRIQSRKEVIIRTYYKLIKVDSSLCEVSYPCLERCVQELVGYCLAARTAAGPLMICATCLRPPYINLNSLFCSPQQWTDPPMTASATLKKQCRFSMNFKEQKWWGGRGSLNLQTFTKFIVDAHLHTDVLTEKNRFFFFSCMWGQTVVS